VPAGRRSQPGGKPAGHSKRSLCAALRLRPAERTSCWRLRQRVGRRRPATCTRLSERPSSKRPSQRISQGRSHNVQEAGMGQSASPDRLTRWAAAAADAGRGSQRASGCTQHSRKTHAKTTMQITRDQGNNQSFMLTIPAATVFVKRRAAPLHGYTTLGMASR
jgi:hypothetical protein